MVLEWVVGLAALAAVAAALSAGRKRDRMRLRELHAALRERTGQQQQAESRLQEFLVALQNSPNGVILLDDKARIEWCNQTAALHFGLNPAKDQMQYIGNLLRDPEFATNLASWNYSREVVLARPMEASTPLKLAVQVHAYAGNRRLLLSRDVTAVEQADAMRRDFVANVSHEIRTPLTVLSGFVETLQTLPLDVADRQRYLGLMATQARRMQALVDDLLTLSRLEGSPPPPIHTDWTPVASLLRQCEVEATALSATLAPGVGHQLQVVSDGGQAENGEAATRGASVQGDTAQGGAAEGALEVSGNASELQSALSNLLNNAVRYTPPGKRIVVACRKLPDGGAEFAVQDCGAGIAPEHISRLTERFYRVDRSRSRETGGTGLGLAIVKHVAQRHGGELLIDSKLGQGSTFTLRLPAARVRHKPALATVV